MTATPRTVNLWNAGTFRGEQPGRRQAVLLPAALVKITIILPHYNEAGRYDIAVTRDKEGRDLWPMATERQAAREIGKKSRLSRFCGNPCPGSYFLSTTHEQNQASYYYALQIK